MLIFMSLRSLLWYLFQSEPLWISFLKKNLLITSADIFDSHKMVKKTNSTFLGPILTRFFELLNVRYLGISLLCILLLCGNSMPWGVTNQCIVAWGIINTRHTHSVFYLNHTLVLKHYSCLSSVLKCIFLLI